MKKMFRNGFIIALIGVLLLNSNGLTAQNDDQYFAGNQLKQIGILKGYPDGGLHLEDNITRAEVATMMVRVRGFENKTVTGEGKSFKDLKKDHWAYANIQNAFKLGIIQGYPEGDFRPQNNISYAEIVAIMVNTLGYKDKISGNWPDNYINKGKELNVIPKNSGVDSKKIVTRGEMALIVWDTLLVKLADDQLLNQN